MLELRSPTRTQAQTPRHSMRVAVTDGSERSRRAIQFPCANGSIWLKGWGGREEFGPRVGPPTLVAVERGIQRGARAARHTDRWLSLRLGAGLARAPDSLARRAAASEVVVLAPRLHPGIT